MGHSTCEALHVRDSMLGNAHRATNDPDHQEPSDNGEESYDDHYWYAQLVYIPVPRLYLSVQYRNRTRDYTTSDPLHRNFGRKDDRPQWSVVSTLKMTKRLTGILYYSNEDAQSTLAGRDFQADVLIVMLAVKL